MNRYVLAISGGVDSVVLLDMFATGKISTIYHLPTTNYQIIVAHFDHGIRDDSAEDAKFVGELAKKYGLKYETKREELGKDASEELARNRRYQFLRSVAKKYDAQLVTAHHSDDVIESVAINLSRGTGWRGLAVMDSDVVRPLWNMSKDEIISYAKVNKLKWHEDSTNASDKYLRNRVRQKLLKLDDDSKRQLLSLWMQQKNTKMRIEQELGATFNSQNVYSRYFFICIDNDSAIECLRHITSGQLTRPQLNNLLIAIKTYSSGKEYSAGSGIKLIFTSRNFTVKMLK